MCDIWHDCRDNTAFREAGKTRMCHFHCRFIAELLTRFICRVVGHILSVYHDQQIPFHSAVTRCFLGGAKGAFVREKVHPARDTPGDGLVERVCSEDNTLRLRVLHVSTVRASSEDYWFQLAMGRREFKPR